MSHFTDVDFNGSPFNYNCQTSTYCRPSVSIKYPCRLCGSERPQTVDKTPSGGYSVNIGICCVPDLETPQVDKGSLIGNAKEESNKCNLN